MKMKKLLAVVLTGVMAVSMLTGCASIKTRQIADELEGMLRGANTKATVKAVDDDLAAAAIKGIKNDDGTLKTGDAAKTGVKEKLTTEKYKDKNNDKYIWYACFATKDLKKADKAQKVAKTIVGANGQINTTAAVNSDSVKVGEKTGDNIKAGDKFELSMKEFTVGTGEAKTDYVMVVVTCKAVEVPTEAAE